MVLLYRMLFVGSLLLLLVSLPLWGAESSITAPTIVLLIISFLIPLLWPIALVDRFHINVAI